MQQLEEKQWQRFKVFKDGVLNIATTSSSIDGIRLIDGQDEQVPYVTRSDSDNGISRFVSEKNYVFGSDSAECITVGLDTQTAFYQPYSFVTGQNIQVITGDEVAEDTAMFLTPILKNQMRAKFNWGGNGATLGRMEHLEALLPVDGDGNPDWDYMASYTGAMRQSLLGRYKSYVVERVSELEYREIPALDKVEWAVFTIEEVFDICPGKRLEKRNMVDGQRPFIGASDSNNGVTAFVSNTNESCDRNVLGINYNGSVCEAFYHPYECVFSDDVKRLHLKQAEDTEALLLFMGTIIHQQKGKYEYSYKFNEQRMHRQSIVLPSTPAGSPDYAYMEQYAKNMMLRKYRQYLNYIRRTNGCG